MVDALPDEGVDHANCQPALRRLATTRPDDGPCLDLVVPAHDAAHVLAEHITTLHLELMAHFPFTWRITIVDSASTDGTWWIARHLAVDLPQVRAMRVAEAGHGRALRAAWAASDAAVLGYVDADLATGLSALLPLVAPLLSGHSDVAIGSRLAPGARVVAGTERDVAARCHNRLLHLALGTRFRDAQCGFKAVRADVARRLLAKVTADGWFFDTELLVRAERDGLRIVEIPVDWTDAPAGRPHLVAGALDDARGIARLVRELGPRRQIHRRRATLGPVADTGRADRPTAA